MTNPPFKKPELTDLCAVCGHYFGKHSMDDVPRCPGVRAWLKTTFTPVEKAAKEETQTVARASEFLTQWPNLVPAIQRLVEAKLREQIGVAGPPEVAASAFADEARTHIYGSDLHFRNGGIDLLIQRAMDAARYDERAKVRVAVSELESDRRREQAEVARLTKELAEKRQEHSATLRNVLRTEGGAGLLASDLTEACLELSKQLAAAQSALAEAKATKATDETELKSLMRALADKQREVANVMNQWARSDIDIRAELSTERAALECTISQRNALRAQLQQAERERDEARARNEVYALGCGIADAQLSSLRAELAAAQELLKEERAVSGLERLMAQRDSLAVELAETQETVRRVERERDLLRMRSRVERCLECGSLVSDWVEHETRNGRICRPCDSLILVRDERDALQKQNAEMLAEIADHRADRVNIMLSLEKAEARNAELVKAFISAMATVNAYCGHRYSHPDSER